MNTKLYVENLSEITTESELIRLFSTYGNVVDVNIAMHQSGQKSRRLGSVTMVTPEAARAAMSSLNGKVIGAEILAVSETPPREEVTKSFYPGRNPRRGPSTLY